MGYKLLLADDSITIQKVVGIIFANSDYDLTVVDNGEAALAKARETAPDIMLVDALMPGKSGYEVCEDVRRDPVLKDVPILLLTGAFEPFDETKARQSGADDFISKPFESQQLMDKVANLVELGRLRKASVAAAPRQPEPAAQAPQPLTEPLYAELEAAFAEEAPVAPEPIPLGELDIVEVSPDEDLWGELEAEIETEGVEEGEIAFGEIVPEPGDVFAAVPAPPVEEAIFFEEEKPVEAKEVVPLGGLEEAGEYVFQELPAAEPYIFEEPVEQPAVGAAFEFAPAVEAPAAPTAPVAAPGELSEAQLAALVSRISRELIEKIAWEVVPDLAETIIREEIRKIKEGS